MGNAVHAALKLMHSPRTSRLPALEEVINEYCRAWSGETDFPEDGRPPVFQDGLEMLQQHYSREQQRIEPRYTADVERRFDIPFLGDHTITGRVDRVDVLEGEVIEVIDYKTGRTMPAQIDVDGDLQLAIYRMATQEVLYPDKEVLTSLYYLRSGMKFTARLLPEQLEAMRGQIAEVIAGIEKEDFSPRVESSCDWCDFRQQCMVFRPIAPPAEAKADIEAMIKEFAEVEAQYKLASAEVKRIDERRKELQAAVLGWLQQAGTGFYEVGNLQALADSRPKTTYPAELVRAILEPLDLWERVCKVSVTKTAIDNLCRSKEISPIIKQKLQAAAEVHRTPVLKLKRLGDEEDEAEE